LNYCGIAGADRFSACVKPIRLNATDRAIFANPNLSGTALLWHNLVVQNAITKRGGQGLTDTAKFETAPAELTNAGAQCAAFIQKSISGVPVTSQWFPIDADQLSIANALDGTVIATFNPTTRHYGVLPHTAAKCGTSFCDSNWNLDNIVRKHTFTAATLAKFSVVGIPE
jgi:hypothetical protein